MKTPSREWTQLAASAAALTDSKFLKIVELFERIRHEPGIAEAMGMFRPRLVELRPPRRITASRLFFLPVEDLLDDLERYQRKLSRVCRATIDPCWRIVADGFGEKRLAKLERTLLETDSHDVSAIVRLGEPLWKEGSRALGKALDEAETNQKARIALFGRDDDVLRQVAVTVAVTDIGAFLQEVKSKLPDRPIQTLAEFHVEVLRSAIKELAQDDIRRVTPFLLVLSARMLRPGDLLAVLGDTRLDGYQQEKDEMAREVGVFALENLLRQSGDMSKAMGEGAAAKEIASIAERLLDGFDSMKTTLQRPDQKAMVKRVDRARAVISDALLERVINPADQELLGHVNRLADSNLLRMGLDEPTFPTPEEIGKAEEFARAYRRCARIAPLVGLKSEVQEKTADICRTVRKVSENLGNVARPARGPVRVDPAVADEQFVSMLRLIEIIAGPDEAETLLTDWHERIGDLPKPPPLNPWGDD